MEEKIYWIIKNEEKELFEREVAEALGRGYQLQGGVHTDVDEGVVMYYQAVFKQTEE